jgi:hypothetical protein
MPRILVVLLLCLAAYAVQAQRAARVKCGFRCYPAYIDSTTQQIFLHNQQSRIGRKIGVATGYTLGYEAAIYGLLYALPENVSRWSSATKRNFGSNYRNTFTKPIALDKDQWYVNYVGHPYQGAFYYNSMRAQGAEMRQSSLFAFANTYVWEFLLEGAIEQPSIQDLVVTPIAGTLLGELFHLATIRMSRKGYTWYEKAFVCVFNPAFAIHNGFKWAKPKPRVF